MPLFYQHTINDSVKLAIWHITEAEDFFINEVSLKGTVKHPQKRLQHLAGRYLLKILQPAFPFDSILIEASKKPVLPKNEFHFSISHCGDFAAAIISDQFLVGIDVELVTSKIKRVEHKFLNPEEHALIDPNLSRDRNLEILTLLWSAKESMYKWYGKGSVDFKENLLIKQIQHQSDRGIIKAQFSKEIEQDLEIHYQFFDSLCLAWVMG